MTENDLKKKIYRLGDLTPTEKLTLLVVLSFVDWTTWEGSASINQIADALSTHRRAISRALKGLTEKGYIERTSKRLGRQMNTRSDMRLNLDRINGGDNPSLGGDNPSHKGGDIKSLGGDNVSHRGGDNMSLGGDDSSHKGGDNVSLGGDIKSPIYIQPNNQLNYQPNNQPNSQPNNQQARATRGVAVEEVSIELEGKCYKPYSYTPVDLNEEKKKRRHTLTAAFKRCGLEQQYKIRWIRWFSRWREENCPLWHHFPWTKYDIDVKPAIEQIKEEQERAKEMRHPSWTN